MTAQSINVHAGIDVLAAFANANAEYFGIAIRNKQRLIEWYKINKKEEVDRIANMFDKLIENTEIELVELQKHIDFLGLRIPTEPSVVDGENFIENVRRGATNG